MNLYYELLKEPVFSLQDIYKYYTHPEAARSALKKLLKQGIVVRIRKNMYTCISGETESPVANRYQIACALHPTAYISHHTAMEYYGVCDQIFYDVYVSSQKPFKAFEFDGYTYLYVASKCQSGIEEVRYSGGVRITNKERTVIDSIKDMDKISEIEEVLANIAAISSLNDTLMLQYLAEYKKQFLYQKTGCLLYPFREQMNLGNQFFEECRKKIGMSRRYLTNETSSGKFNREWNLVVPDSIFQLKNGGADYD